MSTLKEYIDQHGGQYKEEPLKKTYTSDGEYSVHIERGKCKSDYGVLHIYSNDSINGIFKMTLKPHFHINTSIRIYPRSFLGKLITKLFSRARFHIPDRIYGKYKFEMNRDVINRIPPDEEYYTILDSCVISITSSKKDQRLDLVCHYGIGSLSDLEDFTKILELTALQVTDVQ